MVLVLTLLTAAICNAKAFDIWSVDTERHDLQVRHLRVFGGRLFARPRCPHTLLVHVLQDMALSLATSRMRFTAFRSSCLSGCSEYLETEVLGPLEVDQRGEGVRWACMATSHYGLDISQSYAE